MRSILSIISCSITLACLAVILWIPAAEAKDMKGYTLAVIPNLPAVTLHKKWTPLAEHLSRETGVKIELRVYENNETFLEDMYNGRADFVFSSPNLYYLASQKQKYIPLVRSSQMIKGRLFVRKDSPYMKLSDLKGKSIAFVGTKSVCGVIARQALLKNMGPQDYTMSFLGSTLNVAKSVHLGKNDAGAALDIGMMKEDAEMNRNFRILLESEEMAPHPLAAHPRVPRKLQQAVANAVLALDATEQGRNILETIRLTKPVRADYKRDYSVYGSYNFDLLDKQLAQQTLKQ